MISLKDIAQTIKLEKGDDEEGRINMDDPIMQKTGWSKDNPDLTVGGVLKQGEKHPEYKAARAIVDKEKGGEEKPKPSGKALGKGDFERDLDDSEPEDKPHGGDTGVDADFGMDDDDIEDDEEARAQAFADMEDEFGDEDEDDMEEEIITINGRKYKPIKELVEPTIYDPKKHLMREMYERIGGK